MHTAEMSSETRTSSFLADGETQLSRVSRDGCKSRISVANPEKHGEGIRDAYISYEIVADEVPLSLDCIASQH